MNYPKWWGDGSAEKEKQTAKQVAKQTPQNPQPPQLEQRQNNQATHTNHQMSFQPQLYPQNHVSWQQHFEPEYQNPQPYHINPKTHIETPQNPAHSQPIVPYTQSLNNSQVHSYHPEFSQDDALKKLREDREKYIQDKRIETVPKQHQSEHTNSTAPLKSVMRNSESVKAKGGVALHYEMQDLCRHGIVDERPISPAQHELYNRSVNDRRDREARKQMGITHNTEDYTLWKSDNKNTSSPLKPQHTSIKDLIKRDKQLAMERRERLESARNKNKPADQFDSYVHNRKSFDITSNKHKKRSMTGTKDSGSKSPTSGARRA